MQHYRFYYLDESSKFIGFGEDDFADEALAVAVAQQRLAQRPRQIIEVWQQTKMVYRGKGSAATAAL